MINVKFNTTLSVSCMQVDSEHYRGVGTETYDSAKYCKVCLRAGSGETVQQYSTNNKYVSAKQRHHIHAKTYYKYTTMAWHYILCSFQGFEYNSFPKLLKIEISRSSL